MRDLSSSSLLMGVCADQPREHMRRWSKGITWLITWTQNQHAHPLDYLIQAHPRAMPDLIGSFEFLQINRATSATAQRPGGFEFTNQHGYVEPYAQHLKRLIVALYSHAQPELG
jgi:hypothetical protein